MFEPIFDMILEFNGKPYNRYDVQPGSNVLELKDGNIVITTIPSDERVHSIAVEKMTCDSLLKVTEALRIFEDLKLWDKSCIVTFFNDIEDRLPHIGVMCTDFVLRNENKDALEQRVKNAVLKNKYKKLIENWRFEADGFEESDNDVRAASLRYCASQLEELTK
jgi:hypothetical protein